MRMMHNPLSMCCSVVDSVSCIARNVSDRITPVNRNSGGDTHCTPMTRHPVQQMIACAATMKPKKM